MRVASANLNTYLKASNNSYWSADVFLNGARVYERVPISNVQFTEDSTALVQATGSFEIRYQDVAGQSIAPSSIYDALSPFGTIVTLYFTVTAGPGFSETVRMGSYLVSETPLINATWKLFQGGMLSFGDVIDVNVQDLFFRTQRNTYSTPQSPPSLASVWTEMARLSGLPVTINAGDATIPAATTYQSNPLQAIYDLANVLDATACVLSDGSLSTRPNTWPAVVGTIRGGDGGALISAPRAMQNANVYNKIDVLDAQGNLLASGQITTGPLRTANPDGSLSPYGTVTLSYQDPLITSVGQAQAYIAANLGRVSSLRGMQVPVTELVNPLRELGDVLTIQRIASGQVAEQFTGRVQGINRGSGKTQQLTLAVNQ